MATKQHRTAYTSILSWKEIIRKGLPIREKSLVCKYLRSATEPRTSRRIAEELQKERTNITRSLNDLVNDGIVEIPFSAKCPVTGKRVYHYRMRKGTFI